MKNVVKAITGAGFLISGVILLIASELLNFRLAFVALITSFLFIGVGFVLSLMSLGFADDKD